MQAPVNLRDIPAHELTPERLDALAVEVERAQRQASTGDSPVGTVPEPAGLEDEAQRGQLRFAVQPCERCGVLRKPWLDWSAQCRCGMAYAAALERLQHIDPDGRLTLEALDTSVEDDARPLSKAVYYGRQAMTGERRKGMLLSGTAGGGKTHIMVGLLREALAAGRIACWHNTVELVRRLQATYDRDYAGPSKATILSGIFAHEVVMLDDLGQERATDDVRAMLYELVDGLYSRRRTLVVSTNVELGEMASRYDDPVVSRLRAMCSGIAVSSSDYRTREAY